MKTEASRRPFKFLVVFSLFVSFLPINTSKSVAATYGAPSAPQSIIQTANASGVTLTWSAPATGTPNSYVIEKSTDGTSWSSVTSVSSGTTSYLISSGLSPSTSYFFRIAAVSSGTQGAYGYPWTKLYGTTTAVRDGSGNIVYESSFGITAGDAFSTASSSFSRVRYRFATTINAVSRYADLDFYKWSTDKTAASVSPSITNLRIPSTSGTSSQFTIQANVTDLNVYSNSSSVSSGYGMTGRLEIWPWNYGTALSGLSPAGNSGNYDYDDTPSGDSGYGSFQVHDLDAYKPVFVWNRHGDGPEIAYGKNPADHPDWTFCKTGSGSSFCPAPSAFSLQIYVNSPITTSAVITPANTAVPTISGTTTFGETLTSTTGTWSNSPTSYTYQWSRSATSGGSYTSIPTAINSTYRLEAADVGQYLKVTVTATNASGSASATSAATAQITKATPTFSAWSNVTKTFGDANYTVTAPTVTGSIPGSFSYSSSNTGVISISSSTFTVAGGGSTTITATFTPTDTVNYNSATTTNTVTVNKAPQTAITITTTTATYGSTLTLASTGGSTGGTYTYTKVSGNCTLSGAVLTPTATGSCVVQSSLATDANYLAETSTATTITISSGTVSASLTLEPGNLIFRQAKNITAVATVAGKITFRVAGKILPGCKNKSVSAGNSFTAICSYRPSNHSYVTITATLNPTDSYYVGTVTNSAQYLVTRRVGPRVP